MFFVRELAPSDGRKASVISDDEDGPRESAIARVERHQVTIGVAISGWRLTELKMAVHTDALAHYHSGDPDLALDMFAHCLALEQRASMWRRDPSFKAAVR